MIILHSMSESLGTVHAVEISRLLSTTPTVQHSHYVDVTPTSSQDTERTVFLSSSEAQSKVVQSKSVAQVFFHAQLGRICPYYSVLQRSNQEQKFSVCLLASSSALLLTQAADGSGQVVVR